MQRLIGWGIFFVIVALVMGAAIWGNISTNRLLDDATSGVPDRQKSALKRLAQREDFFDLLQSREKPERLRLADGIEHLGDATAVKVGLAMLKDPEPVVRERFLQSLTKIGKPNVKEFVAGLKDGDSNVKRGTVKVMVALGLDSLPVALEAVNNADARGAAGEVLIKLGSPSVPGLLKILNETQDEAIKLFVMETLGKIGDKRATPVLQTYLNLPPEKRRIVISALGLIADPRAEADLVRALRDLNEDGDARVQAALGLGKIASPTAISDLIRALKDMDQKVRLAAVVGLQRAGAKALPALQAALRDPDTDTRVLSVQALGGIPTPGAITLLAVALRDADPRVRRAAATALGETGRPEAVAVLVGALSSSDGGVVMAASEALVKIGDMAVPSLLNALRSPNETVAYYAARALSQMGERSVEPLLNTARDPSRRRWALAALAEMRAARAKPLFKEALNSKDPSLQQLARQALMSLQP